MSASENIQSISKTVEGICVQIENNKEPLVINRESLEGCIAFNKRAYTVLTHRFNVCTNIESYFQGILRKTMVTDVINSVFVKASIPIVCDSTEEELQILDGEIECVNFTHKNHSELQPIAVRVDKGRSNCLLDNSKTEIKLYLPVYSKGDDSVGLYGHWELANEPIIFVDNVLLVIKAVSEFFSLIEIDNAYELVQFELQADNDVKGKVSRINTDEYKSDEHKDDDRSDYLNCCDEVSYLIHGVAAVYLTDNTEEAIWILNDCFSNNQKPFDAVLKVKPINLTEDRFTTALNFANISMENGASREEANKEFIKELGLFELVIKE
jgi:hypothetical protein